MLARGENGRAYNLGSQTDYSLREVAQIVADVASQSRAERLKVLLGRAPDHTAAPSRYVPSMQRAQNELQFHQTIDLPNAIARTLRWYRQAEAEHKPNGISLP
jgi:nucleoside-diphosphate-sugar epimerase